jgi:hypothetical protein
MSPFDPERTKLRRGLRPAFESEILYLMLLLYGKNRIKSDDITDGVIALGDGVFS